MNITIYIPTLQEASQFVAPVADTILGICGGNPFVFYVVWYVLTAILLVRVLLTKEYRQTGGVTNDDGDWASMIIASLLWPLICVLCVVTGIFWIFQKVITLGLKPSRQSIF